MPKGCIESQAIVVPAGGWSVHIDDGTVFDATVPAGTYSPSSLLVTLEAAIEAGSAVTYSASIAISEGGTGLVTITGSVVFTLAWTSTDLRDVLGFYSDLPGPAVIAATYSSAYGIKGLYLPDAPYLSPYGSADPGHTEGGPTQTVSPLGVTKTLVRPTRVKMPSIRWSHIIAARARQAAETGAPRSFERFVRETMFGAVSYFRPGGAWRFYWSADNLSSYTDYNPVAPRTTAMDAADPQWRGLYAVEFGGWAV